LDKIWANFGKTVNLDKLGKIWYGKICVKFD